MLKMKWDMIIAFPPCTHLAVSGASWFEEKRKDGRQRDAIEFFCRFLYADCEKKKVHLVFSHVNEQPMNVMRKSGFVDKVGNENFCAHIDDALKRAQDLQ